MNTKNNCKYNTHIKSRSRSRSRRINSIEDANKENSNKLNKFIERLKTFERVRFDLVIKESFHNTINSHQNNQKVLILERNDNKDWIYYFLYCRVVLN